MTADISTEDLRLIHEHLPYEEAQAVKTLAAALAEFIVADDKAKAAERIALRLEPLGVRGLSLNSLYRKAAACAELGWRGAVDGRILRKLSAAGLGGNKEFVEHWHTLVASNQRKTAPAWRALLESIRNGKSIPGVGDWRAIWQAENPGMTLPSECPYGVRAPHDQVPRNMSYSALMRLKPTAFGVRAARVGTMSASADFLPDVLRTRVGLKRCQVIQIDDMWDNAKVMFSGNRYGERVVELSAIDVLTGRIICHLSKPVIRDDDGTAKTLKSEWTRYLIAHICCTLGIPDKLLIMGEHGTATIDKDMRAALAEVSGGRVTFGAGGLLSQPIAKGLYDGRPKGNPKYKGLLESMHGYKQNELASIKGQIGSRDSLGNEPEAVYGMDKLQRALATAVAALEQSRPGIQERLAWPWAPWEDYAALKAACYDGINRRTNHEIEGWAECGFLAAEWRPAAGQPWMPIAALDAMGGEAAAAMRAAIGRNPALFRARKMSPEEAWHSRAAEVKPLGDWAAPLILGRQLAKVCEVSPKLEMFFSDESTMRRCKIYAVVGGVPLERGREYLAWVNPCDCGKAYIADLQGRFIGVAKVAQAAQHDDFEAIKEALGTRQQALSDEIHRLRPIAHKRLRETAADAEQNAEEILGYDPAATAIARAQLERTTSAADFDDFFAETAPEKRDMVDAGEFI